MGCMLVIMALILIADHPLMSIVLVLIALAVNSKK